MKEGLQLLFICQVIHRGSQLCWPDAVVISGCRELIFKLAWLVWCVWISLPASAEDCSTTACLRPPALPVNGGPKWPERKEKLALWKNYWVRCVLRRLGFSDECLFLSFTVESGYESAAEDRWTDATDGKAGTNDRLLLVWVCCLQNATSAPTDASIKRWPAFSFFPPLKWVEAAALYRRCHLVVPVATKVLGAAGRAHSYPDSLWPVRGRNDFVVVAELFSSFYSVHYLT